MKKKRRKFSRMRGSHTHGTGFMKKARGSGHRGGFGNSGTGKRGDQKKTKILNMETKYFGKPSLKAKPKNYKVINVGNLEYVAKGKKELDLKRYKILGKGDIKSAINVNASMASKSAIEKIENAGGKVLLPEMKVKKEKSKNGSEGSA